MTDTWAETEFKNLDLGDKPNPFRDVSFLKVIYLGVGFNLLFQKVD